MMNCEICNKPITNDIDTIRLWLMKMELVYCHLSCYKTKTAAELNKKFRVDFIEEITDKEYYKHEL